MAQTLYALQISRVFRCMLFCPLKTNYFFLEPSILIQFLLTVCYQKVQKISIYLNFHEKPSRACDMTPLFMSSDTGIPSSAFWATLQVCKQFHVGSWRDSEVSLFWTTFYLILLSEVATPLWIHYQVYSEDKTPPLVSQLTKNNLN